MLAKSRFECGNTLCHRPREMRGAGPLGELKIREHIQDEHDDAGPLWNGTVHVVGEARQLRFQAIFRGPKYWLD